MGTFTEYFLCARHSASLFADIISNPTSKIYYNFYRWGSSKRQVTSQGKLVEEGFEPSPLDSKIYTPLLTPLLFTGIFLSGYLTQLASLPYRVNPLWVLRWLKTPDQYFFSIFLLFCYWQTPISNGTSNSPSPHLRSWEPVHLTSVGGLASSMVSRQWLTHKAIQRDRMNWGTPHLFDLLKEMLCLLKACF